MLRRPKSTVALGKTRSSDKLENLHPSLLCKKCGACYWNRESIPLTWSCVKCGNLVYIELGQPVQQIDVLLRSNRKQEFKRTERGTVVPVPEE